MLELATSTQRTTSVLGTVAVTFFVVGLFLSALAAGLGVTFRADQKAGYHRKADLGPYWKAILRVGAVLGGVGLLLIIVAYAGGDWRGA